MSNDDKDEPTELDLFKEEFCRRLVEPSKYLTFKFYFGFVILFLAGVGWIIPFGMMLYYGNGEENREFISFSQSLSTYAIALAATSFVDLIISKNDPKISQSPFKNLFSMVMMAAFVLVAGLAFWTFSSMASGWAFILALIGTIVSLIVWWIANGDSAKSMEEEPRPDASMGGNPKGGAGTPEALRGGLNQ